MAAIQDQTYVKLCAQLASRLSISLASARRRVDQAAARGRRDVEGRRAMAQSLLDALDNNAEESGAESPERLNALLSASEVTAISSSRTEIAAPSAISARRSG